MSTRKQFGRQERIAQRLAHLLSINSKHVRMHPVFNRIFPRCTFRLSDLAFVMWELEIHSSTVYVERLTKIFCTHHRTFNMPSRKSISPRRWPSHDVRRGGFLPKCKVDLISLLILAVK